MSFEEMHNMILEIKQQVVIINKKLHPPQPSAENRIITGPEMQRILGVSKTQFAIMQKRMTFLFRYTNGGTLRAWRSDFENWLRTEYSPKI